MSDKTKIEYDSLDNHLPKWTEELDIELIAVMSKEDRERYSGLINRYYELSDKKEDDKDDTYSLYGIDWEQEQIAADVLKLLTKYKEEALRYQKILRNQPTE